MEWSNGENFEACDYDDFLDQSLDSPHIQLSASPNIDNILARM